MSRDNYGNYVNKEGVTIKAHTDKYGRVHVDFYDGPVDEDHDYVHTRFDPKEEKFRGYHDDDPKAKEDHNCFLTTACMKVHTENFDDNCYELQTLRWFRDHHVNQEDIDHYYRIAPDIVRAIDASEHATDVYIDLYYRVIRLCIHAIERQRYDIAYHVYRKAVLELEKKFLAGN